jgi:tRNA pseudouridine55 synthase
MDGILIIDKPPGITSHDVITRVRRKLKTKKVGHTGTLDPFATGVMVVVIGRATRLAQFLDKDEKQYEATIQFGFETETGDSTGLQRAGCEISNADMDKTIADIRWEDILERFRGEIDQVPPMYSAKKVAGRRLYEHARKGETIERNAVKVVVSQLDLLPADQADTLGADHTRASSLGIRVTCSAGTYIRTLAEDIGRAVGIGAHLSELRRTRSGRFDIVGAIGLDQFESMQTAAERLLPIGSAVEHLPVFMLAADRVEKTKNGLSTRTHSTVLSPGETVRMVSPSGDLIAIGYFDVSEGTVRPRVVLV